MMESEDLVERTNEPVFFGDDEEEDNVFADLSSEINKEPKPNVAAEPSKTENVVFFSEDQSIDSYYSTKPKNTESTTANKPSKDDEDLEAIFGMHNQQDQVKEDRSANTQTKKERDDDEEEEEDEEEDPQARTGVEGAIPMDKLKNGASNAYKLWQWGFSKVQEKTKEVSEQLQQNENVRQASERFGELYESNMKPGFEKVKEAATPVVSGLKERANSAYEKSKPKLEELRERSKPALDEFTVRAGETWNLTKQKVSELSEACRPGIHKASESVFSWSQDQPPQPPKQSGAPVVGEGPPPYADI